MNQIEALRKENEELKKVNFFLQKSVEQNSEKISSLSSITEEQKAEITHLNNIIINLKRDIFGRKSEKIDSHEHLYGSLFNEAEDSLNAPESSPDGHSEREHVASYTRKKSGRKPLPADIPREIIIHDIPESEKTCNCGSKLTHIGEEVSEQLTYIPAKIAAKRHVRLKYACTNCKGSERDEAGKIVVVAELPEQLLPKSILTPEFFVYILISKFLDHIPFYRMEKILLRFGIEVTRATFSNWVIGVYERYKHLFGFWKELLMEGLLLGIDETTLQVHNEQGREDTKKSYMWVIRGGHPDKPIIEYIYRETRSAKFLTEYLTDYSGTIQTDGFTSYDVHFRNNDAITHIACMAHIRREFENIWKSDKDPHAKTVLNEIQKLYVIEGKIRDAGLHPNRNYSEIAKIRMDKSKPIFDSLHKILREYEIKFLPKSSLGEATRYALGQWTKMERYLHHGESYIDNNLVENDVRPFVLGRKNWLFSGCPEGAEASAFWYSIIQTLKANNKEPYQALLQFIAALPFCKTTPDTRALFCKIIGS